MVENFDQSLKISIELSLEEISILIFSISKFQFFFRISYDDVISDQGRKYCDISPKYL